LSFPIAIFDPVPAYRRGLLAALEDVGLRAEAPDDLEAWAVAGGSRAALLTINFPEGLDTLAKLTKVNAELVTVALLREFTADAYRNVLAAGASGAAPWDAQPEIVVRVLRAAWDQQCILPVQMAHALAMPGTLPKPELSTVTLCEAKWLRMLASGATVAELAHEASYSEREMFRLLQRLYEKMGVRNRTEALVKAARAGLLS
jgi:DNA-binding NarL/FixJ family response regulator